LHNNNSTNNLKVRYDIIDISAEDDIQIIHTSLAKEIKKENIMDNNLKSVKCLNGNNKSDFDEKMDISSIENNSDDDINDRGIRKTYKNNINKQNINNINKQNNALYFTENPNFVHMDDQIIKCENELQITDDEGAHMIDVERNTACSRSPIKLKKTKHEPKTRFSIIDVVDLSDDEEGIFPYSQLFDIKYEDNTAKKIEIKQEYDNDDEPNTEKIGLLNVDDEVIILTDSEDEDNPWLERLSRSQLFNEDIKPISCDVIIKDEIDLGIWDDEILNTIEQSEIPCISQIPYNKEISLESPTSVDVETKNKKDNYDTHLPKMDAMVVKKAVFSNDSSIKDINENKQIISDKNKQKTNVKPNIELDKQTIENVKQKLIAPTTEVNAMDVDEVGSSNELNTRDENKQIIDINIDGKNKQKTDAKQDIELDEQTIENIKQKLIAKSTSKRLIPVIEPLSLPSRKRRSDHSKNGTTKVHETAQSRVTKEKKISKLKDKFNDYFYSKEQKNYKEKSKSVTDSFSLSETKSGLSISKDEKKKIIEQRKMKLKEIAAEEKKLAAGNNQSIKRRNKPRAKISLKNRGDFLISEQEQVSKLLPDKEELPKLSDDQFKRSTDQADVKESATSDKKTQKSHQKMDISTVNNIATSLQQSLHLDNTTASKKSTLHFKATDDKKKHSSSKSRIKRSNVNTDFTAKMSELRDNSIERGSAIQTNFSPSSLKSKCMISKKNKRVSFSDKIEIRKYEIDQRNTLKKLVWKDAPIPTNKLTRTPAIYTDWSPKLEEFLLRIFMWNPVWLEEQRYLKRERYETIL